MYTIEIETKTELSAEVFKQTRNRDIFPLNEYYKIISEGCSAMAMCTGYVKVTLKKGETVLKEIAFASKDND